MKRPLIAIPSFPGSNGEVDNVRVLKRCGFDCFVFRWNDSLEKLKDVDGYFFGAGFSYEDRGRSGMVAARDPLFRFMHEEAGRGKVIVGNCNGAQVLVESGLIPASDKLRMCLAHNAIREADGAWKSPGFLNEWVWVTPVCKKGRCATADWTGTMHIPIAHGEGRFVTQDPALIAELKANDQIAFCYCDEKGAVSPDTPFTPNGSTGGIAGICNPAGNVVAFMPHPERTPLGDAYFHSIRTWIAAKHKAPASVSVAKPVAISPDIRQPMHTEIFIDTVITNNEERTVEQAARRMIPSLALKQFRYVGLASDTSKALLSTLSFFNPNKEIAYVRTRGTFAKWNSDTRTTEPASSAVLKGISLLRRDVPDSAAAGLGEHAQTGVCYDCSSVSESALFMSDACEVFCNPHSSLLERLA